MPESNKIKPSHLRRAAFVYVRQSTATQVEYHRESTQRQYALVDKACALGWQCDQVSTVDEDLGLSGASAAHRSGFTRMTTEVALSRVGIILGLEVSRLARNNADWYQLLDLCAMTDTLIGDADGIYHPGLFNDRLVLGLKGTMSEAELHTLRARLDGGIRNKAARGELRRGLPVGFVWGKHDGEVLFHPNQVKKRVRKLPRSQWSVLIPEHHKGFVDWNTYEAIQTRIASNTRPLPHQDGSGAVREGAALLQGLATCGHCGRKLRTHYRGKNHTPGYHCAGKNIVNGRGVYCLNVGGVQIDQALTNAFLEVITPAGLEAALVAAEQLETNHDAALSQWQLAVERASYEANSAERRYRAVEPENRLVARGLEAQWERCLHELEQAQAELSRRETLRPKALSPEERQTLLALATDIKTVWRAPTTTPRDQKELLRTLLEEVIIAVYRDEFRAHLTLRWRGGLLTELDVELPRSRPATVRTDEETVALVRRLAIHYPDAVIAGILNRQGRTTARGLRFTANLVGNLRRHWKIPRFIPTEDAPDGELVNIKQASSILGIAPSTIHRWLNDGFIAGEQLTPGAPWKIRLTEELFSRFVDQTPEGYVTMQEATKRLGVTRQTVLQRVKNGELDAVHVSHGRRKGIRIKMIDNQPDLFQQPH
jgi:excisionase family DNA binding protein